MIRRLPLLLLAILLVTLLYFRPLNTLRDLEIPYHVISSNNTEARFVVPPSRVPSKTFEDRDKCPSLRPPSKCTSFEPTQCTCPTLTPEETTFTTDPNHSQENTHFQDQPSQEENTIAALRRAGIIIIFKTGAQELSMFTLHAATTLRQLSSSEILFFSDQAGSLGPFIITDVLAHVSQTIQDTHKDFEIYRQIREYQRTGRDVSELREEKAVGDGRKGWVLDKYKFLHMMEETYKSKPGGKWYVFIETDSYVIWRNLVLWLERLESVRGGERGGDKPMFLGSAVWMGDSLFAHGGSGYVLNNGALSRLVGEGRKGELARVWDDRVQRECCGDVALGIALKESGVELQDVNPFANGMKPTSMTYGPDGHWCKPVVFMHSFLPHEISSLWRFERSREAMGNTDPIIFADLFYQFVEPHLTTSIENWDNLSDQTIWKDPEIMKQDEERKAEGEKATEQKGQMSNEEEKKKDEEENGRIDDPVDKAPDEEEFKKEAAKKIMETEIAKGRENEKVKEGKIILSESKKGKERPEEKAEDKKLDEKEFEQKKLDVKKAFEKKPDPNKPAKIVDNKFGKISLTELPGQAKAPIPSNLTLTKEEQSAKKHTKRHVNELRWWSELERSAFKSFEDCHKLCEELGNCFQFVHTGDECRLSNSFRLGRYQEVVDNKEYKSGWMLDRIRTWQVDNVCGELEW